MKGVIDTDEFILALGTIDLGELPPPQKPKREVPSLPEPVNTFCREILRDMTSGSRLAPLKTPFKNQPENK